MAYFEMLIKAWRVMNTLCAAVQVFSAVHSVGKMADTLQDLENQIRRLTENDNEGCEDGVQPARQHRTGGV